MRRTLGIAFVAILALGLTACSSGSSSSMNDSSSTTSSTKVVIKTFRFRPTALRVPAGTKVTWTNRDDIKHTVTSDDSDTGRAFSGPVDGIGAKFSHTFATAGTYAYHCSIHPGMNARVVVSK